MQNALITGATGFVGFNLTETLLERHWKVRCLVRDPARADELAAAGAELTLGTLHDSQALAQAVAGVDCVFHVAGRVSALKAREFHYDNVDGTRHVLQACAEADPVPTVVMVSSLAAGGPSQPDAPRRETDPSQPVSAYGRSKLESEQAAREFADRVPLSIVRPPVVFGRRDRNSLTLFKTVRSMRVHAVPGFAHMPMSIVHVADLCDALIRVAERGDRIRGNATSVNELSAGLYYVTSGRTITYSEFGRLAAFGLGNGVMVLPVPKTLFWIAGGAAEGVARIRRRPGILNWDKIREAVAGCWECSDDKLRRDVGYVPAAPLEQRFTDTARWYRKQGWL